MAWDVPNFSLANQPTISANWSQPIVASNERRRERQTMADQLAGREQAIAEARNPDGSVNWAKASEVLMGRGDVEGTRYAASIAENEADNSFRQDRAKADDAYRAQSLDIQRMNASQRAKTPEDEARARAGLAAQHGLDPNSPEGRSFILTGNLPPNRQARVPVGIQNAEAADLESVQSLGTMNSELNRFKGLIEGGKLPLSGVGNVVARGQNFLGLSDEGSRNFASFSSTLEKLRNESLRLNKGVQTEGDSQRAWDELIANINDPEVVKQRIDEITRLNSIASEFKQNLVRQRREDNNLNQLDLGRMISAPQSGQPPQQAPQAQINEGARARNPSTGQMIEFRGGQWVPVQ